LGVSVWVADGKVTLAGTSCGGRLRKQAEKIAHVTAGTLQIDIRIVKRADPRQRVLRPYTADDRP
jgi:hypothetical protein